MLLSAAANGDWLAPVAFRSGLQSPVMPAPDGTSRSQVATCGLNFVAFDSMFTLADSRPGDVASTVMLPAVFAD